MSSKLQLSFLVSSQAKFHDNFQGIDLDDPTSTSFDIDVEQEGANHSFACQIHDIGAVENRMASQHTDGLIIYLVDNECLPVIQPVLDAYKRIPMKIFYSHEATLGADVAGQYNAKFVNHDADADMEQILVESFNELNAAIKQVFDSIDENKNGTLEFNELERACQELGHEPTSEEMKTALRVMDTDKNGSVSLDEFAGWWRSGRQGLSPNMGKAFKRRTDKMGSGLQKLLGSANPPDKKETVSHIINFKSGSEFDEGRASLKVNIQVGDTSSSLAEALQNISPPNPDYFFTIGLKPKSANTLKKAQKVLKRLENNFNEWEEAFKLEAHESSGRIWLHFGPGSEFDTSMLVRDVEQFQNNLLFCNEGVTQSVDFSATTVNGILELYQFMKTQPSASIYQLFMEGMVGSIEIKVWKHLFAVALNALQYANEQEQFSLFAALHLLNESEFNLEFRSLSDLPMEILRAFTDESESAVGNFMEGFIDFLANAMENAPAMKQLIELLRDDCDPSFEIRVKLDKIAISLSLNVPGFELFVNKIPPFDELKVESIATKADKPFEIKGLSSVLNEFPGVVIEVKEALKMYERKLNDFIDSYSQIENLRKISLPRSWSIRELLTNVPKLVAAHSSSPITNVRGVLLPPFDSNVNHEDYENYKKLATLILRYDEAKLDLVAEEIKKMADTTVPGQTFTFQFALTQVPPAAKYAIVLGRLKALHAEFNKEVGEVENSANLDEINNKSRPLVGREVSLKEVADIIQSAF